jgi:NAD(P)H-hydrate epimerase
MTVGGTGDVLSGIVGAFLAQGVEPLRAATCGAYVNGAAGDLCLREKGYWFTATDLLGKIPEVLRRIWRGSR